MTGTKIWNNLVISKDRTIMAIQNKRQDLAAAVAYLDYNFYDAPPVYEFGEYTANRQRLTLDQLRTAGFEEHSRVVADGGEFFEEEKTYRLRPAWATAGRNAEPPGPADVAEVLDVARYGPAAVRP